MKFLKIVGWFLFAILNSFPVISLIYFFMMWVFLTIAAALFLGNFLQAAGIVSAVVLFQLTRGRYERELYIRSLEMNEELYAKSNEKERV